MNRSLLPSLFILFIGFSPHATGFRTWTCADNKCVKEETTVLENAIGLNECKVKCLKFGGLWPRPTGLFNMSTNVSEIEISKTTFEHSDPSNVVIDLLTKAENRFLRQITSKNEAVDPAEFKILKRLKIYLEIDNPSVGPFTTDTDESYSLQVFPPNESNEVLVTIDGNTFFGVRHGLETLRQLIFYDDVHKIHKIFTEVQIDDRPEFTHRGIVLDTARSYISVPNIIKILDVMAMNKMNTFHWHMTDSQSFPYVSSTFPELSTNGAYSSDQVYTENDIKQIVEVAQSLGIRVVPEFDAPAHVGEGWEALGSDLVTCFKWQPWREYCVEPPCGQLDPTNDKVYDILGTIYKEYVDLFQSDLFHMGGDEVNVNCWRSTERIKTWMDKMNMSQTTEGYYKLWGMYQDKALSKLKETKSNSTPRAILWTSTLTQPEFIDDHLKPEDYIIQVWTSKTDNSIKSLIDKKFRIIFSNYDELYLDCGGPSWVGGPGRNWCSPFIGWQQVYHHSPYDIINGTGVDVNDETKSLILGSEAAVWTEQIDDSNVHVRLWPRAAALAERLWSNPKEDWTDAQFRMNHHRERMAKEIQTEVLQPQWCYQNDGFCD